MATEPTAYWADLAENLSDPEFRRVYVAEARRIAAVDDAVNATERAQEQR
jgi:hypothetical protein